MKPSWKTSIRTKIFSGCVFLTFVTLLAGVLSQRSQVQLTDTARKLYDNAFISMSDLRSAQTNVLTISADLAAEVKNNAVYVDQLQSVLDSLDVAGERAMSGEGANSIRSLTVSVGALQRKLTAGSEPPRIGDLADIEREFDTAVDVYARDGLRFRNRVEILASQTARQTYAMMFGSVVIAIVITFVLSHAIVPSIRRAVTIATSIADGKLDNHIGRGDSSETAILFTALATMQDSISDKISCIQTLVDSQASSHAAEIKVQNTRFEAALDNMKMGLCMIDASGDLLVHNRRFVEMFAQGRPDFDIRAVLSELAADDSGLGPSASRAYNRDLDDGRTIAISEEPMDGGARVVIYEDITERKRAEAHMSYMARHDVLTGLPNRMLYREEVERGLVRVRSRGFLAVLCIDLDRFKDVNDTLGHPVGDVLLQQTASRLVEASGEDAMVVRLGGDEFAVILYFHDGEDQAADLAMRIVSGLQAPFQIEDHRIAISASIGIALAVDGYESPDVLLKNADLALYQAKADGKDTYRFFRREMDVAIQAKRSLEVDLRAAADSGALELYYQPLLDARTRAVVSCEALLRWNHPERGPIPPSQFIPLAEETGLIQSIGRWVMEKACTDAMTWPNDVKVAINLSPLQFRGSGLVGDVVSALENSGLPATRLDLEITESLMLQDTTATLAKLHDLRALGIRFSMDDFGTGYSSISYLLRFPFDKIKIDRSFVSGMVTGNDELAIVKSIIALGKSLRMNVVAEGVETDEEMRLLCRAGCHELQGYLISRPRPLSAIVGIIQSHASTEPVKPVRSQRTSARRFA